MFNLFIMSQEYKSLNNKYVAFILGNYCRLFNMFCEKCGNELETNHKYCFECGTAIVQKVETPLQSLLKTEIKTSRLIYEAFAPGVTYGCKIKSGNVVNKNTPNFLTTILQSNHMLKDYEISHQLAKRSNVFTADNYQEKLFILYSIYNCGYNDLTYQGAYTNWMDRLIIDLPILTMCKIKHCYLRCYNGKTGQENSFGTSGTEQLGHILIALIENNISNPTFGFHGTSMLGSSILFKSDPDIYVTHRSEYSTDPKNDDNIFNITAKEGTHDDIKTIYDFYAKGKPDQPRQTAPYDAKRSECDYYAERWNKQMVYIKECQTELDKMLNNIKFDLYYSRRNKKIYCLEDLEVIFAPELLIYKLDFSKESTLFKIKHINVFIFEEHIDKLFDNVETREIDKRCKKLEIREGIDGKLVDLLIKHDAVESYKKSGLVTNS